MPRILQVEDNEGDVLLTQEAFAITEYEADFVVADNGRRALEYLRSSETADALPDLILLDINMPVLNGKEFLSEMKFDESLRHIPVVVLTTSTSTYDIRECYRLHANAYLFKSIDFNTYTETIDAIARFWLGCNVSSPRN